jgi:hypothetical protein
MISATTSKQQFTLTSGTQTIAVPFYFLENSHVKVVRTRNGVDTTLTAGFTISGAGDADGGQIVFSGAGTIAGDRITVMRVVPILQLTSYAPNDRFPASSHERALDKLTMLVQMVEEKVGRALLYKEGEVIGNGHALPAVAVRALKLLGFDANGLLDLTVSIEDVRRLIVANPVGGLPDVFDYGTLGETTGVFDYGTI